MNDSSLSIEERLARLEGALGWYADAPPLSTTVTAVSLAMGGGAIFCSYQGLGEPNHYYQWALGFLTVFLAYHRDWLRKAKGPLCWVLGFVNGLQVSMLYKLFIGSGVRKPFSWLFYPEVIKRPEGGKWWELLPDWSMSWAPTPLAVWEVDITLIQTFLLLITIVGAMFRFQPFVSLTALLLILTSIPAFSSFHWAFVFPAVSLTALGVYIQTRGPHPIWHGEISMEG